MSAQPLAICVALKLANVYDNTVYAAGTGIDVTTLTQWIDRNAEYDAALAHLYQATIDAHGRITKDLRQAAIDVHDFATAISVLGAFIYQVQAQSAKKINAGYAALLIGWAADLIARL